MWLVIRVPCGFPVLCYWWWLGWSPSKLYVFQRLYVDAVSFSSFACLFLVLFLHLVRVVRSGVSVLPRCLPWLSLSSPVLHFGHLCGFLCSLVRSPWCSFFPEPQREVLCFPPPSVPFHLPLPLHGPETPTCHLFLIPRLLWPSTFSFSPPVPSSQWSWDTFPDTQPWDPTPVCWPRG